MVAATGISASGRRQIKIPWTASGKVNRIATLNLMSVGGGSRW